MNKMNALSGQGFAHSEIGQSVICRELKFHDRVVIPYDNGDGKIWFTADTLAGLLGYADKDKVLNLFYRHEDEFSPSMTTVAKMRVNGINNSLREIDTRLFSPRGAHLIGMFARTKVAKELRVWLLDLVEKEGADPQLGVHHTIEQMRNIVAAAWKASDEDSSDAGRRLRKRQDDLPELVNAQKLVDEIGQIPFVLIGGGKVGVYE
nr:MAG TPA: antirepressor [Caudoviricetes sp.]